MKRIEYTDGAWKFPFVSYSNQISAKKLPLIIQLHGAGERGSGKEELSRVDLFGFSAVVRGDTIHECMVVMPQCPKDTFWAVRVESILEFIGQIKETFPIDEDRVYLTGLSMGGFGTWFTAMARPDLFAAIVPICGGGMAWNAHMLTMPVWAFHGCEDEIVPVFHSDDMVNAMKKAGLDITYTRVEGAGHDVWTDAYNTELLEWLLSKKRS